MLLARFPLVPPISLLVLILFLLPMIDKRTSIIHTCIAIAPLFMPSCSASLLMNPLTLTHRHQYVRLQQQAAADRVLLWNDFQHPDQPGLDNSAHHQPAQQRCRAYPSNVLQLQVFSPRPISVKQPHRMAYHRHSCSSAANYPGSRMARTEWFLVRGTGLRHAWHGRGGYLRVYAMPR